MKRSFLVMLGVALLVGGGVLTAQEVKIGNGVLTLNGKVATGVFFDNDNVAKEADNGAAINAGYLGADGRVKMYNESDPGKGLRTDFTVAYTLNNAGFRFRLRADDDLEGTDRGVMGRYAFGYIDLLNNKLRATGGYIDLSANVWGTQGDLDADVSGNGVRLEVKPIEGLNAGVFFRVPQKGTTAFASAPQVLAETAFGLRYVNPLFYTNLQFVLDSDFDGDPVLKADQTTYSKASDEQRLLFGVGLTAVENLKVTAEGDINGLGNWAARGKGDFRQTVSYGLGDLTVGVKAKELLYGYDLKALKGLDKKYSPWMQFKPFVTYQLNSSFTAGLEGGFGFGDAEASASAAGNGVKEKYNVYAKPNLSVALGLLNVKLWYKLTAIGYDEWEGVAFTGIQAADGTAVDSLLQNQIALEFIWSF
jgi:hypothetical protein